MIVKWGMYIDVYVCIYIYMGFWKQWFSRDLTNVRRDENMVGVNMVLAYGQFS